MPGGFTNKDIANIRHRHTTAQNKMELKGQVVDDFETRMGIEERWMMTHPERVRAQSRIANVQYHKAVDDVERLVVMRLLELMKLQMSGYKLRTQISKALKTRATAIRNALNRYNKYAAELNPPRPPITWEQEEIVRCNVKITRLRTKIQDSTIHFPVVIAQLCISNPALAVEVQHRWDHLRSVNAFHLCHIAQIEALPGYSGSRAAGTRLGHTDSTPRQAQPEGNINEGNVDDDVHDDPDGKQQTLMEDFFDQLHDGPTCADDA
ncbi:hypothetical protein DFJ58DRAFT_731138 [Suillus subalutaceus]|uniref:uncharacterized protein n=1 Tax=Suillus subalutaceus TaxID=48586 RepID=UPI001B87A22B|nr:uncharacterized protein DFJ58DRAFT_731138 [Suillus subalutaceus]KAG1844617.1 hypothetical protein DFJ58DRAFT_731138 [Suillus subalutaceus]